MNVATQMGNQGTADKKLRNTAAVVRSGVLGNVKEVHVWTNRPIWPQGGSRPAEAPVPSNVHWDLWLGPAPFRPYAPGYHPFAWRGWWDFGSGALGDMACHTVNMPFMALDLRDPTAVVAETSGHNRDSYPKWSIITYDFPANDNRGACKMVWYDGGKKPSPDLIDGEACPLWLGHPATAHWGIPDPAHVEGDEARRAAFEKAAQQLTRRIQLFMALPIAKLDKLVLKEKLTEIGKIQD
jgi:predicted dehydrogenase